MHSVASPVHRLDVDDVLRMAAAGILGEHARVELVEGVLVDMQPIGPQHDAVLARLVEHMARRGLQTRVQSMLLTPDGYAQETVARAGDTVDVLAEGIPPLDVAWLLGDA